MSRYADRFQPGLMFDAPEPDDFAGQTVLVGVSGGINSAALLVYLLTQHPEAMRPARLLLFSALIAKHPPGVNRFALDMMRWARARHPDVRLGVSRASVLRFFEAEGFIPHPTLSPCTSALKLVPMAAWASSQGGYDVDLVGYVRSERRRILRQQARGVTDKGYPVAHLSTADCFALVGEHVGHHPQVYDLRQRSGRPAFNNANCLPCKNMSTGQLRRVAEHFPAEWSRAEATAARIGSYWGREAAPDACAVCAFD